MARERRHPVSFSTTKSWNRRRKELGLTWRKAAEIGIRGQELVEELMEAKGTAGDSAAVLPTGDASSPVSAA